MTNLDSIPQELKAWKQWVCWRKVKKDDGRIDKIPVDPRTGDNASTVNPKTWGTFTEAVDHYRSNGGKLAGVGFVFIEDNPFFGVDYDHCLKDGKIFSPQVKAHVAKLSTYTEISPSNTGLHSIGKGKLPSGWREGPEFEIYDKGRYFTVTGDHFDGTPTEIRDLNKEVASFHHETFDKKKNPPGWEKEARKPKAPGHRTPTIEQLAGRYITKKLSDQEALDLLYLTNERNKPPLSKEKVKGTYHNIKKTHARNHPSSAEDPETLEAEYMDELNKVHAVVMAGGSCVILNEEIDPIFGWADITLSRPTDFRSRYLNRKISNPKWVEYQNKIQQEEKTPGGRPPSKYISIAQSWLESPERRQYKGIIFSPQHPLDGYYNLWRGFGFEPKKGNWSLLRAHINEIICSGVEGHFKFVMKWMADKVQNPGGERPGTSIVLRGERGVGKGIFGSGLGKIFGKHHVHITNPRHIIGNFNFHLKDCLLAFVDEGFWAGDKTAEGVLKGLITEDTMMVESKGKDAFEVKNHMSVIMASNHNWIIPAGMEERRFLVLDVSNKRRGDQKYFVKIIEQLNTGGYEAMLYDLIHYNTSDEINLREPPKTEALLDQIIRSADCIKKFWIDCLYRGTITIEYELQEKKYTKEENIDTKDGIRTEAFYKEYCNYCRQLKLRPEGDKTLGKQLLKLCPASKKRRLTERESTERVHRYFFPALGICREIFQNQVGMKNIDWNEISEEEDFAQNEKASIQDIDDKTDENVPF